MYIRELTFYAITDFKLYCIRYICERWTLRKNEETRLDVVEIKRTEKDSASFVDNLRPTRQRVTKELLDTVKARKLAYYGHTMMKQGSCLEKEIMQ